MGVGGECGGPGDVAMAGGIEGVAGFAEDPFGAVEGFAEGEEVSGDVRLGAGEALLSHRELVHEGESEVVLFGGKVNLGKGAAELSGGFPANLSAETGVVAGGLEGF